MCRRRRPRGLVGREMWRMTWPTGTCKALGALELVCFSSFCWGSKSPSLVGYLKWIQMVDGRLQAEAPGCLLLCKPMNYS